MLNMKGSTGYFGCTQCEIEGESVQFQNVNSLEILLSREINLNNLNDVEKALDLFVFELEFLYDEHIMVSGTHEVLHLVQCTREIGPLKFNLFQI
jgi:hypothetical protein